MVGEIEAKEASKVGEKATKEVRNSGSVEAEETARLAEPEAQR
jgi:hypothetical protein